MITDALKTSDITFRKIHYEKWKAFDISVQQATDDAFTTDLSSRFGDCFISIDWDNQVEVIDNKVFVDGVFVQDRLVGLVDYTIGTTKRLDVTTINFMLIHPEVQGQGIGSLLIRKVIELCPTPYVMMQPVSTSSRFLCQKLGFSYDETVCPTYDYVVLKKEKYENN